MICPECLKEGKKSRVFDKGASRTLMGSYPYCDEEGVYHDHDPNTYTYSYQCSLGHHFYESKKSQCPSCDFGSVQIETKKKKKK